MQTNIIERIRNEADIVQIISKSLNLTKKGNNFISLCPFHEDKNPSLIISNQKQIFKCFSCGKGGDIITFISCYKQISFQSAIEELAEELGINHKKVEQEAKYNEAEKKLLAAMNDANDFFMNSLMLKENEPVLEYALSRGLNNEIREKFKIGFCPKNLLLDYLKNKNYDEAVLINASLINQNQKVFFKERLTFAISNEHGNIIGFSGRTINSQSEIKYLNSSDSLVFKKGEYFYNWFNAKEQISITGQIFIVEGFMDTIAFWKIGIKNVVALMGTNFSNYHLNLLKNLNVVLMLDQDEAGIKASEKIILKLIKHKINVEIIKNSTNYDPDELFFQDNGKTLKEIINQRKGAIEYIYDLFFSEKEIKNINQIEDFMKKFKPFWSYGNELEQEFFLNKISKDLNLSNKICLKLLGGFANYTKKNYQKQPKTNLNSEQIIKLQEIYNNQKNINYNDKNKLKLTSYNKKKSITFKVKPKNYQYLVIRSMLKNPDFIPIFKKSYLKFDDKLLDAIGNLFQQYPKVLNLDLEVKKRCQIILSEGDEIANSSNEFQEYIERVKWINSRKLNQKIIESVKHINNPNIALKLLEEQIKLKRSK